MRAVQVLLREGEVSVAGWEIPVDPPYELPADPEGRYRCWAILMATPGLYYRGEWQDWPAEDLQALKTHQARLLSLGYEIPLIILHNEAATEGRRKGHLGAFEVVDGRSDGQTYLLGAVTFTDPNAADLHRRGEYRYVSAGIDAYWDDTGYTVPFGIYEVSITQRPWQKRLGPTHLLSEDAMDPKDPKTPPTPPAEPPAQASNAEPPAAEPPPEEAAPEVDQMAGLVSALVAEVGGLRGRVEALEAILAPPQEAAVEPPPAMMAEVCRKMGLSESDSASVLSLAKTDPSAALNLVFRLSPAAPAKGPGWSRQSGPSTPPAAKKTKQALYAECLATAGGDASKALELYQAGLKAGDIQE